jgi:hypothetical protein
MQKIKNVVLPNVLGFLVFFGSLGAGAGCCGGSTNTPVTTQAHFDWSRQLQVIVVAQMVTIFVAPVIKVWTDYGAVKLRRRLIILHKRIAKKFFNKEVAITLAPPASSCCSDACCGQAASSCCDEANKSGKEK